MNTDIVITGEGCLDSQTAMGKAPIGIAKLAKKYSKQTLEECCRQALALNRVTYTFIKNSIPAIAAEMMTDEDRKKLNDQKNKGAYVMSADASDIGRLLAKSKALADEAGKGGR